MTLYVNAIGFGVTWLSSITFKKISLACIWYPLYRVFEKKICKENVRSFDINKSNGDMKHNDLNVTNEILAFECRLFQPIWILRSGDMLICPREVKIPIVPLFAELDKVTQSVLLIGTYWSCWLERIHSLHNSVTVLVTMFLFHIFCFFFIKYIK